MTATTPIFGLSYPEGSDLVSTAPDSFKAMADTFEEALYKVDRRSTPKGAKPVIATTLNTLATLTGVTGQTGYVTGGDQQDQGQYTYGNDSWGNVVIQDVTSLFTKTNDNWTTKYAKLLLIDHSLLHVSISLTRVNSSWGGGKAWDSSPIGTVNGISSPTEIHVPCVANINNPASGLIVQFINNQLNLRKTSSSEIVNVNTWLELSATLPITM